MGGASPPRMPGLTGRRTTKVRWVLQGTSYPPQPCLISAKSADPWHKVVRRGVSPAFSPENIRCVLLLSRHPLAEDT